MTSIALGNRSEGSAFSSRASVKVADSECEFRSEKAYRSLEPVNIPEQTCTTVIRCFEKTIATKSARPSRLMADDVHATEHLNHLAIL